MELLRSSLALAKLEVQNAVRTMCYSLKRCTTRCIPGFKFVDRFPVRCRRTGFHKKEWFLPDTAHQIMLRISASTAVRYSSFCASWIIIPRYHVQNILEFFVIQTVIIIHQICCYRQFRTTLADRINLILMKSIVWYVTNLFQSSFNAWSSFSPLGDGLSIWSKLLYL